MKIEEKGSAKTMWSADLILENLLDAVLVVDKTGKIIYANRAAQELFSLNISELEGQAFGFPVAPDKTQEIEVFKAGKLRTVQMLASRIHWEGQMASLLSLRDVTEQKQIEQDLIRQQKLLEKTNEENAQYASLASHDLKEPIRKILIFADRLLGSHQLPDREKSDILKIQSSARRMHSLINSISQLSKISHARQAFTSVNLNSVVEEVVNDLELLVEETQAIIEVSTLPTIDAITSEMYQLFLNLISNAVKYSKKNVAPYIRIYESQTDDGYVCIECADNGIGFDNKMSLKLFQPFQRLHSKEYDGMGIGLTLCQKIIKVHHGHITAQGIPGEGATFRIRLPREQLQKE
ncbi:MAG: PAS domain-containing sensor histidine kinase [Flavisolibacter sp.]|jgi:light-regulated signal transduction histidine kinase (bacteriophytochrome)